MAKLIIIDDNGATINVTLNNPVSSSKNQNLYPGALNDYLFTCTCGKVVLQATTIDHPEETLCQACDTSIGTLRYNELLKLFGLKAVHEFFAEMDAKTEVNCGDAEEAMTFYYLEGINEDVHIMAADIKNNLNELDEEDYMRYKHGFDKV